MKHLSSLFVCLEYSQSIRVFLHPVVRNKKAQLLIEGNVEAADTDLMMTMLQHIFNQIVEFQSPRTKNGRKRFF